MSPTIRQGEALTGKTEFRKRLERLIGLVEAWSYAESDQGARYPVELARELKALALAAPSPGLRQRVRAAQDALDDGLPAEAVAGALYRIRADPDAGGGQRSAPPSPSG